MVQLVPNLFCYGLLISVAICPNFHFVCLWFHPRSNPLALPTDFRFTPDDTLKRDPLFRRDIIYPLMTTYSHGSFYFYRFVPQNDLSRFDGLSLSCVHDDDLAAECMRNGSLSLLFACITTKTGLNLWEYHTRFNIRITWFLNLDDNRARHNSLSGYSVTERSNIPMVARQTTELTIKDKTTIWDNLPRWLLYSRAIVVYVLASIATDLKFRS